MSLFSTFVQIRHNRFCLVRDMARIFYKLIYEKKFSDLGSGDEKKSSEKDQFSGHFQSIFFNIPRTNSKTSKVNQQSVINL